MADEPEFGEGRGPTAVAFGVYYPKGYVVAVLEDSEKANAAAAELRQVGCDDITVWTGEQVLTNHEQMTRERSLLQRLQSLIASDEKEALDSYLQNARQGRSFVTAFAPRPDQVQRVQAILAGHGARHMHHYGQDVMTDLSSHPSGGA